MTTSSRPDDADRWHDGMRLRVLVDADQSSGQLTLCKIDAPAGASTTVHRHEREDEIVHVVDGILEVWTREGLRELHAGETVRLLRGVPHRLTAHRPAGARALIAFVPGGVEAALLAASTDAADERLDPDDLAALLAVAGITVLPWEQPSASMR